MMRVLIKSAPNYGNKIQCTKCTNKDIAWDKTDDMLRLWHDEKSSSEIVKLAKNKRFPNMKKLYMKEVHRKQDVFRNIINFNIPYMINKLWLGYTQLDLLEPYDFDQLMNVFKYHVREEIELHSISLTIPNINAIMSNVSSISRLILSGIDLTSDFGDIVISPCSLSELKELELGESYSNMDPFKFAMIKSIQMSPHSYQNLHKVFLRFEEEDNTGEIREVIEIIRELRPNIKIDVKIKRQKY